MGITTSRVMKKLYPPPLFLNRGGRLHDFVKQWAAPARIIEVGAGRRRLRPDIVTLDIEPAPAIDLVGAAEALPFRTGMIDAVFSNAVMEHVQDAQAAAAEALRVLRPGGEVYVEMPFLARYHACPHDYRRLTVEGLRALFQAFEEIDAGACRGPASALAELSQEVAASFTDTPLAKTAIRFVTGWLLQPMKLWDYYLIRKKSAPIAAYAVYFWGRKPS